MPFSTQPNPELTFFENYKAHLLSIGEHLKVKAHDLCSAASNFIDQLPGESPSDDEKQRFYQAKNPLHHELHLFVKRVAYDHLGRMSLPLHDMYDYTDELLAMAIFFVLFLLHPALTIAFSSTFVFALQHMAINIVIDCLALTATLALMELVKATRFLNTKQQNDLEYALTATYLFIDATVSLLAGCFAIGLISTFSVLTRPIVTAIHGWTTPATDDHAHRFFSPDQPRQRSRQESRQLPSVLPCL